MSFLNGKYNVAATAGAIAIGAVLAVSSFSAVRAEHTSHFDATKVCNKSAVCQAYQNSGPALEAVTTAQNTRAFYVYATNAGADGTDITGGYIGIIGRAPAGNGAYPLVLTDANGNDLNFTDGDGDFYYTGALAQFSRTRLGQRVVSYAPQVTTRTLEDVGSGRLVNGQATISLDRAFAQSIDLQSPYHVFITPNGDTRGLYVASKTASTFVVRETQGGRASLGFDYRIVGAALGHAGERMGLTLPAEPRASVGR